MALDYYTGAPAVRQSIINDGGNFEMNDYLASDYHTGASVNRSFYVDDGTNAGYAYHGSALLDPGASINLFGVHANASLINPRRSPARVAGYSAAARRHADKFGRVFMCVTDGTRRTDEGMAELHIHTMTDMNDDLISASEMIKRAGYKSINFCKMMTLH